MRSFRQVDVFTTTPYAGNPVAVVHGADGLDGEQMQRFARWTNLSETTFLLQPQDATADYRVRIFTPVSELPFAGHPTLGTCHAWLEAGGTPQDDDVIQECPAGLIRVRRIEERLAFAAPPLIRSGPVQDDLLDRIRHALKTPFSDSQWVDNGPGWVAVMLENAQAVLDAEPDFIDLDLGLVGLHPDGTPELRAFFPKDGTLVEDPVTGSLNASVAGWLLGNGTLTAPYVARQGTAIGRAGRIHVTQDDDGTIWVGGGTITCIEGRVER